MNMKYIRDLAPGDYVRGTKGPRRVVRNLRLLTPKGKVQILFLDADGKLRYAAWSALNSITLLPQATI